MRAKVTRGLFFLPFLCGLWLVLAGLSLALAPAPASAQQTLTARSTLTGQGLRLEGDRDRVVVSLALSQPVPWRVFTLDKPWRVVADFSELDWRGVPAPGADPALGIASVATGTFRPGWSRLVIGLDRPMAVAEAAMETGPDGARMRLVLAGTTAEAFAAGAGAPASALFSQAETSALPPSDGPDRFTVVLDPGHGGIDPGAERDGIREKDLMLTLAREVRDELRRASDDIEVLLTRDDDYFLALEERVRFARRAGADVFVSLHADALAEGEASGATVYTLSDEASDEASARLAERHNRIDLLAGVDFSRTEDDVALTLMDIARTETRPRSERLARALVAGLFSATGSTYKTPHMRAAFSVLKAPDIPSALVELGFLSSETDRARLLDPAWRARAATGIRQAILAWMAEEAALAGRLRK